MIFLFCLMNKQKYVDKNKIIFTKKKGIAINSNSFN